MGALAKHAKELSDHLNAAGISSAIQITKLKIPGILIVPLPELTFDILDGQSASAVYKAWAIAGGTGDFETASKLEDLVLRAAEVLDIESTRLGAYQLPTASDPLPAVELTLTSDVVDVTT